MALNLTATVADFLNKNAENKFTSKQIAQWIFEAYPDECRQKQRRSKAEVILLDTDAALIMQIASEISAQRPQLQKKYPQIKTIENRPRHYYYTLQTDQDEINNAETVIKKPLTNSTQAIPANEQALYPKLSEYLSVELGVYSRRINERRSSNSRGPGGNKWLYPDLVGMEDLSREWHQEIRECVKQYADRKTKLWSFEVKLLINRSNVREVFFQTVSNSSWANLGYLVAAEIEGRETIKELLILTSLHGIGVMRLNVENPAESEILIPARERSDVDWNTANRLVNENPDFLEYLELVRQFYQTGNLRAKDWDYHGG